MTKTESCANQGADVRQFGIPGLIALEGSGPKLRDMATSKQLRAGETLFWEDDPIRFACLLTDGAVKAYKLLPNGRSQIIRFIIGGEIIGSTFCDNHNSSAEALSDCAIVQLPRQPLEKLMAADPVLMRSFSVKVAQEAQLAQKQALLLGRMPAVERVSNFLLDFAMRQNADCSEFEPGFCVELPMTRADIADYLGLTIETVSRVFSKFRRDGLIGLPRPNLVVLTDQTGLRRHSIAQI